MIRKLCLLAPALILGGCLAGAAPTKTPEGTKDTFESKRKIIERGVRFIGSSKKLPAKLSYEKYRISCLQTFGDTPSSARAETVIEHIEQKESRIRSQVKEPHVRKRNISKNITNAVKADTGCSVIVYYEEITQNGQEIIKFAIEEDILKQFILKKNELDS